VVKDMLDYMGLGCKVCSSSEEAKEAMIDFSRVETCRERDEIFSAIDSTRSTRLKDICYPCEFFGSDTDGEKTFEEFYTATDEKDETTFVNLGVVKNAKRRPVEEVENIFAGLYRVFNREGATKEDVVEVLKEYLPNFSHISKGKSLDGRM
jgi:hypothetical protein